MKESENSIRSNITEAEINAKYEKALSETKGEIVIEINGKTVRFQKNGETYDLMHNGA